MTSPLIGMREISCNPGAVTVRQTGFGGGTTFAPVLRRDSSDRQLSPECERAALMNRRWTILIVAGLGLALLAWQTVRGGRTAAVPGAGPQAEKPALHPVCIRTPNGPPQIPT